MPAGRHLYSALLVESSSSTPSSAAYRPTPWVPCSCRLASVLRSTPNAGPSCGLVQTVHLAPNASSPGDPERRPAPQADPPTSPPRLLSLGALGCHPAHTTGLGWQSCRGSLDGAPPTVAGIPEDDDCDGRQRPQHRLLEGHVAPGCSTRRPHAGAAQPCGRELDLCLRRRACRGQERGLAPPLRPGGLRT